MVSVRVSSSPEARGAQRAPVLVAYRVRGGPAAVDQRLTVFEDGAVELDERHRKRDAIWLQLERGELDALLAAAARMPTRRWSNRIGLLPRLLGGSGRRSRVPGTLAAGNRVELRLPRGASIGQGGEQPVDEAVTPLLEQLDALRVEAIRSVPR